MMPELFYASSGYTPCAWIKKSETLLWCCEVLTLNYVTVVQQSAHVVLW